jgi:hypothetical protein
VLPLKVCEADIDNLLRRGFLEPIERQAPAAFERAIAAVLEGV